MIQKIIISLVVVVVAVWIIMRGSGELTNSLPVLTPTQSTSPTVSPASTPTPTSVQKNNLVTYTDSGYSPTILTIKRGETVTWKNASSFKMWTASAIHPTHNNYPGTDISFCDKEKPTLVPMFDSCGGFASGQTWSFEFDNVGTWKYHNHSNPSHTGTIIVE
ncbi:MAG: hypothetical protein WD989_01910 [Candidatus Paceibacterota bacterium]